MFDFKVFIPAGVAGEFRPQCAYSMESIDHEGAERNEELVSADSDYGTVHSFGVAKE